MDWTPSHRLCIKCGFTVAMLRRFVMRRHGETGYKVVEFACPACRWSDRVHRATAEYLDIPYFVRRGGNQFLPR